MCLEITGSWICRNRNEPPGKGVRFRIGLGYNIQSLGSRVQGSQTTG